MKYKKGEICYFIESNVRIRQGIITSCRNGLYIVRISDSGAIRLPEGRLFSNYETAFNKLPEKPSPANPCIHAPFPH